MFRLSADIVTTTVAQEKSANKINLKFLRPGHCAALVYGLI